MFVAIAAAATPPACEPPPGGQLSSERWELCHAAYLLDHAERERWIEAVTDARVAEMCAATAGCDPARLRRGAVVSEAERMDAVRRLGWLIAEPFERDRALELLASPAGTPPFVEPFVFDLPAGWCATNRRGSVFPSMDPAPTPLFGWVDGCAAEWGGTGEANPELCEAARWLREAEWQMAWETVAARVVAERCPGDTRCPADTRVERVQPAADAAGDAAVRAYEAAITPTERLRADEIYEHATLLSGELGPPPSQRRERTLEETVAWAKEMMARPWYLPPPLFVASVLEAPPAPP